MAFYEEQGSESQSGGKYMKAYEGGPVGPRRPSTFTRDELWYGVTIPLCELTMRAQDWLPITALQWCSGCVHGDLDTVENTAWKLSGRVRAISWM